nr:hypothetical protein [uncultured bacterium]AMP48360.1 hypothetical protein [uncultured bacterium]
MKQYTGVAPFKTLIRLMYPKLVPLVESCSKAHDEAYKAVDWRLGKSATAKIDWDWRWCAKWNIEAAGGDPELLVQADFFYEVARKWGIMRAYLWKIGVRY